MSVRSRSNWNLDVLVFKERGKPEYREKNLSKQGREPTTTSTHIWHRCQDLNQGHNGGRRVLSALCQPRSLKSCWYSTGWKVVLKDPLKKAWGAKAPAPPPSTDSLQTSGKLIRLPGFAKEMRFNIWFVFVLVLFSAFLFSFFSHPVKTNRTTACKSQFSLKQYITDCLLSGTLD